MKNYIVVGGTSGIGLELTKKLSNEGNNVYVISRESKNIDDLENVFHLSVDVTKPFETTGLPEEIHGLAYCAGSINLKPFHRFSDEDFESDFQVNVMGAVRIVRENIKALKAGNASLVFFSTVAVNQGMSFHASVAAAKGGVEGLAKSIAAEYAPKIRANVIAPSLTDTPMADKLLSNDKKREASSERHPLKRVGNAEELASIAHFLLSEQSGWITGQVLGVDGGMSALRP